MKQIINLNDGIIVELNSTTEPKSDSSENYDDGGFEWDCAVPIKPDIITEGVQTRRTRDLLATNDAVEPQSTIIQTTVRSINDVALNLMNFGFKIINTVIP